MYGRTQALFAQYLNDHSTSPHHIYHLASIAVALKLMLQIEDHCSLSTAL